MTAPHDATAVARNLFKTYFALGMGTPGTLRHTQAGFDACFGSFDHPICNFAARLKLDPWVANQIAEAAIERPTFNVYSVTGDSPASRELRDEILSRAGFRRSYSLQQLIWEPSPIECDVEAFLVANDAERQEVSEFMANQFFVRHHASFRRKVAEASFNARELELYAVRDRRSIEACMMVVEDDQTLGLYNLCVRSDLQGRGLGGSLVSFAKQAAYSKGKPLGLQCDDTLIEWYMAQGFVECGFVDVYALSDDRRVAIMN